MKKNTVVGISLSDFVDYVSKAGTKKFSKVKEIKRRPEYEPKFDFWKPLRDSIIRLHKNTGNKKDLDKVIGKITNAKKINPYTTVVKQYKSFLGRKKLEWFDPPKKDWEYEGLKIRLNPEIGLEINGEFHVIKLWFKAEKLSQAKVDCIILLMQEKLRSKKFNDINFSVLDIQQKKFYTKTNLSNEQFPMLEGEVLSFMKIWETLS